MRLRECLAYSILLIIAFNQVVMAQPEVKDSVVFLKLKKEKVKVSIVPDTNVLLRWQNNNEVIIQSLNPKVPVSHVRGVNMEVKDLGGGKYRLFPFYSDTLNYQGGKLLIYCLDAKGISKLNTIKEYKFETPEMPIVKIAGVRSDSVILAKQLLNNKLEASHKGEFVKVLSFNLLYTELGQEKQLTEYSDKFSLEIRNIFRRLEPGDIIKFTDIKVLLRNGYIETIPIITYYIDEERERN